MKKFMAILLAVLMLTFQCTSAMAELTNGSKVTATNTGYSGISFGDGFYGYCIDKTKMGVTTEHGMDFTVIDANGHIMDQADGSDISNEIKVLIVKFFDEYFKGEDGKYLVQNGYYVVPKDNENPLQKAIWALTNGNDEWVQIWCDMERAAEVRALAKSGATIPDHHVEVIGDLQFTFDFKVLLSGNGNVQQNLIAFKVVSEAIPDGGDEGGNTPGGDNGGDEGGNTPGGDNGGDEGGNTPGGDNGGNDGSIPNTGDSSNFMMWIIMLLAGTAALLFMRRKQSA